MSKFTDDFFSFPIKIYDGFSLKKAMKEEEDTDGPVPIDWIVGQVRLPAKDLHRMMWHDGFSRDRTVSDVAENGFDMTSVVHDDYGEFMCTWPRKKFEQKLDEFMEKWNTEKNPVVLPFIHFDPPSPIIAPGDFTITTSGDHPMDQK